MRKWLVSFTSVLAMLLWSGMGMGQAYAAGMPYGIMETMNSTVEELQAEAKSFGIETKGKSLHEIVHEIGHAKLLAKAKELGITTDGKEPRALKKEVMRAELTNEADQLGIKTKGKDIHDLAVEVTKKKLDAKAKELGIDTKGKSIKELVKEIHEKDPSALKDLNPLMFKGMKSKHGVHGHHHHAE